MSHPTIRPQVFRNPPNGPPALVGVHHAILTAHLAQLEARHPDTSDPDEVIKGSAFDHDAVRQAAEKLRRHNAKHKPRSASCKDM